VPSEGRGFRQLVDVFNRLGIPYFLGGSFASALHGIGRATFDADFIADLEFEQAASLVHELIPDFYADADQIRSALSYGRSFNVIHLASAYKFDIFPVGGDAFRASEMRRRQLQKAAAFGEDIELYFATAEDTILSKLVWYNSGGRTSERQWNDIRGVLEIQRGRLDIDYLRKWADYLKVTDLLEAALGELDV